MNNKNENKYIKIKTITSEKTIKEMSQIYNGIIKSNTVKIVIYEEVEMKKSNEVFNKKQIEYLDERFEKEPQWFKNFTKIYQADQERQQAFNKKQDQRWEQQMNFNKFISNDISDIKKDIQAMKNTPTMKRELANNS